MSLTIDHLIFGNGFGLASPYFNATYYWLVDKSKKPRKGYLYQWIGGLGAQLSNFQWFHPLPGERRRLANREFVVFASRRRWCRVEVSWKLVQQSSDLNWANLQISDLKYDLIHGNYH